MIITGNKKAHRLENKGLIDVITQDVNNMTNITQFSQGKQVQVSEHQLRRLLGFVNSASNTFNELQVLTGIIAEKSEDYSIAQTLARLSSSLATNFCDECLEEFDFFKECSPQLVSIFAEELAA